MNTQTVKLDVTKRPAVMPIIYLGQGDKNGTTLVADIYDDGAAFTLTGYSVKFRMKLPYDTAEYNVDGTVSSSTATFAIDEQYAASVAGITDVAYVEVLSGSTVICSTNRMRVVVLESAFEGVDPATIYDNGLNDAIDRAIAAAEAAEGVVLQDVPTMTENIKGGAKLGSGLDVTNSVLSLDLVDSGTGTSVTADDASYLASLTVDGKAVQNGTPTPSSPVDVQVVRGVNLLSQNSETQYSTAGWTIGGSSTGVYIDFEQGTYSISVECTTAASGKQLAVGFMDANSGSVGGVNLSMATTGRVSATLTLSGKAVRVRAYLDGGAFKNFQVERGSTATPFVPYGSIGLKVNDTITPIDLQGNVLASLPDGTKDVLTVDSAGHVVKQNKVGVVDLGTLSWSYSSSGGGFFLAPLNDAKITPSGSTLSNVLCTAYKADTPNNVYAGNRDKIIAQNTNVNMMVHDTSAGTNAATFTTAMDGVKLYYELATPTTTDLGYIDMPAIPDGSTISITAQVTPTISASWWARGAAAIAEALKSLRDNMLARIEAIETAIADL